MTKYIEPQSGREYSHDDILAAAGLVRNCPKASLKEHCILQIDQNRLLQKIVTQSVVDGLGIRDVVKIHAWQNTDDNRVCSTENGMPMIDTLERPFSVMAGGCKGALKDVLTHAEAFSGNPTDGLGMALTGEFITIQGIRTILRLGELGRIRRLPIEKVVRASNAFFCELPDISHPDRGSMFRACRNLVLNNADISAALGSGSLVNVAVVVNGVHDMIHVALAWRLGCGDWQENPLLDIPRKQFFHENSTGQIIAELRKIRPMIFA